VRSRMRIAGRADNLSPVCSSGKGRFMQGP
jgi:hypothetical protein